METLLLLLWERGKHALNAFPFFPVVSGAAAGWHPIERRQDECRLCCWQINHCCCYHVTFREKQIIKAERLAKRQQQENRLLRMCINKAGTGRGCSHGNFRKCHKVAKQPLRFHRVSGPWRLTHGNFTRIWSCQVSAYYIKWPLDKNIFKMSTDHGLWEISYIIMKKSMRAS